MRLKARQDLVYLGQQIPNGWRFDAFENDAFDLINRDLAQPFGLEDPSTRPLSVILDQALPPEPPPPLTVTLNPTQASYPNSGGSGSYNVTMSGSGTWTVQRDSGVNWISITSPPEMEPQSASGTVSYTVSANVPPFPRTGVLFTNDQQFTVSQPVSGHEQTAQHAQTAPSQKGRK